MLGTLDKLLAQRRNYSKHSQNVAVVVGILFVAALAMGFGLGFGLTKRSKGQPLPLPSNSQTFNGDLTYYSPGLGACGITSSDNDDICSVSHLVFDAVSRGSNPNQNPLCGRKLRAARYDESMGKRRSVDLKVVDRCTGCKSFDLDLSLGAFKKLADPDRGRVNVTWAWLPPSSK